MGCCAKKKQNEKSLDELKKDIEMDDHKIPLDDLLKRLQTDLTNGLSSTEAAARLKRDGPNSLTPPPTTPMWVKLVKSVFGGFNMLLWFASAASGLGYVIEVVSKANGEGEAKVDNLYLCIILAVVVSISGLFAFFQEKKSGDIMDSFAHMIPPQAHVLRDGKLIDIKVEEIVKGDVVQVGGGDKIPADLRITLSRGLKVDNSSLTGESDPQSRSPNCTHNNPLETKNVAMFSTSVIEGSGRGIVILTGDRTVVGRIASLTATVSAGPSPIAIEIEHFIHIISFVAFGVGITFFVLALVYGNDFITAVIFFLGMVVANVPEGITATVTVCLTLTAVKMRKKFCLVKNLEAVETLGSTSTICSDKTGTLTQNRMTITHLWFDDKICDAERCHPDGKLIGKKMFERKGTYEALLRCATLCSKSHFKNKDFSVPLPKRETMGDASEVAIMKYCELIRGDGEGEEYRLKMAKVAEIPFNSSNKFQLSIHDMGDRHLLVMKGAPERILSNCESVAIGNTVMPKTPQFEKDFVKAYETLGGYGERVLGFCEMELDPKQYPKGFVFDTEKYNFPTKGLRFLGLLSMIDPPRPGVPTAVALCQSAGIKVVMVTGDHPITARAIATQVNIIKEGEDVVCLIEDDENVPAEELFGGPGRLRKTKAIVVHGEQLKKLSPATVQSIVRNYNQIVFARTSPIQKLQIVEAFQTAGHVVGVTGDGVNDAPALRKADIGIAMGIAGTDVSKQAADMILLNDNFASIVMGVEEGRLIFDNLKKSIAYTLTSNIPEISPFMCYVLLGIPLPMSIVAILMIDLGTDLWPAIALAYEEAETDIMQRPPRNSQTDKLVNKRLVMFSYLHIGMIQAYGAFNVYFVLMMYHGWMPWDLLGIRDKWDNEFVNDLEDSFGQQWSYESRKHLEACCHGAFFYAIVVVQWADLLISKTRKNSIVMQGMNNQVLNCSLAFTGFLCLVLMNAPYLSEVLKITGLRLEVSMLALPYGVLIVLYDELRRYMVRKYPTGWIYRETYF